MADPKVSLAPLDPRDVPPGAILVMVEPAPTELQEALVQNAEDRRTLRRMNRPGRYGLVVTEEEREVVRKRVKSAGRHIWSLIEKWRRG